MDVHVPQFSFDVPLCLSFLLTCFTRPFFKLRAQDLFTVCYLLIIFFNNLFDTWTLTKRMEKRLDGNYTLRVILNKSWRQPPTKQQLYGHLPHITKSINVRRTIHAKYCWRSRDELKSDVLLWTASHGRAKDKQWLLHLKFRWACVSYIQGSLDFF